MPDSSGAAVSTAGLLVLFPVGAAALGAGVAAWRRPGPQLTSGIQHFAAGVVFAALAGEVLPDLRRAGSSRGGPARVQRRGRGVRSDRKHPPEQQRPDHQRREHEPRFVARPKVRAQLRRNFPRRLHRQKSQWRQRERDGNPRRDPKRHRMDSKNHAAPLPRESATPRFRSESPAENPGKISTLSARAT